jgi:PBSX family phage terminase large subunit
MAAAKTQRPRKKQKKQHRMNGVQKAFLLSLIAAGRMNPQLIEACKNHSTEPWDLTERQIQYWRRKMKHRFQELQDNEVLEVMTKGFALKENRIRSLGMLADRMLEDLLASDKKKELIWLERKKSRGSRENFEAFMEEEFNTAQLAQYRGLMDDIAKETGGRNPKLLDESAEALADAHDFSIPAELIASSFADVHRDIKAKAHTEYVFSGGRGSTKSSYVSLAIVALLIATPGVHALAARQVANTIRDSAYSQIYWAIAELGLLDKFKCTKMPLEMEYLPTGQKIYFRGADDPAKLKSIKPAFGYIGFLWFEELDQFRGAAAVRKIEQSVIRGGDEAYIFKSFNPPPTANNWANKYVQIPKDSQYHHFSNYLSVPREWLGKTFLEEAEHLKEVNPPAYDHEYMGVPTSAGGQVFDNVILRAITDDEILGPKNDLGKRIGGLNSKELHGLDWGFFPDPFAYVRCHYDPARLRLYIYQEFRVNKMSNKGTWKEIKKLGVRDQDLIIADSAEPKSIADYKEYGSNTRGAEKGPDSVSYSIKWLQSLAEIIVDPARAPNAAMEFQNYELEMDKDGEWISAYPDKNNHFIDGTRYATNLIWRRRGK